MLLFQIWLVNHKFETIVFRFWKMEWSRKEYWLAVICMYL